jgi:hypothetical protein
LISAFHAPPFFNSWIIEVELAQSRKVYGGKRRGPAEAGRYD